jgi:acetyl esterase/lipase
MTKVTPTRTVMLLVFAIAWHVQQVSAQQIFPLYDGPIPNSRPHTMKEISERGGVKKVSAPTLEVVLPPKELATGAAIIICPGGGYTMEVYKREGLDIATEMTKRGVVAFVLKYRLPSDSIMVDKSIGPLQDAQRAIQIVRQRAAEWGVDPTKVGIMGFSAGGHLASTASTHFDVSYIPNTENVNLRPDFSILVYPVISMEQGLTHQGSRDNLLGKAAAEKQVTLFSNDLQVTANTPPTYLTAASDDKLVPVKNSLLYYEALVNHKVPAEMHLFEKGDHGFGGVKQEDWMAPIWPWMTKMHLLGSK